ncbi:phage holin family protein [Enterococcus cecorum]|nr:phage holin family protein [Enterococcus cecorum]CAI3328155.1 phage holin family protein [Enterococcus cecorum]CAI3468082.1 phage holin family protein [Enterococcus cecorum]CAI3473834.1 phage holin family protein [Enterococcus cecorum]CAI3474630.1 phage holin family protein [Enterococcus cecorum]CAI3475475.1 phage holin family protein [Enterococcus cecorum]
MMIINNFQLLKEFSNLLNNLWIHVFIILVAFDILTGLVKGMKKNSTNSTKGLTGMIKHLLVVILIITAYPYLSLLGLQPYANAFVLYYIASYAISITENLGQMGVPIPEFIKSRIEKLRDLTDKGDGPK